MSKKIDNYEDLLSEKARLEELFKTQKALVMDDFEVVKDHLRPVGHTASNAYSMVSGFTSRRRSPLMNLGMNVGVDFFLKRVLLGRSGWVIRTIVPFLVKNYSAHLLAPKKKSVWDRVKKKFLKS